MDQNHSISRDVQTEVDDRGVHIQEVGISDLRLPLTVCGVERAGASQQVVATVRLAVDLDASLRGIHMSRLVQDILAAEPLFSPASLVKLLEQLRSSQESSTSTVSLAFDYFLERTAPVSEKSAPQPYRCTWTGVLDGDHVSLTQKVDVPVTTLCPCSKEISAYGAHNQRGLVEIEWLQRFELQAGYQVSMVAEEAIEKAEAAASAALYPILKRVDERFVTMQAYDRPRFVEDLIRNVVVSLRDEGGFEAWQVQVTNYESIHQHNATARIRGGNW